MVGVDGKQFSLGDASFVVPCALLILLFVFDFGMAVQAPVCGSPAELGNWSLPLGWQGPFADVWSNRSRSYAVIDAGINLGATALVLAMCLRVFSRVPRASFHRSFVVKLQIGLLIFLVLKGLILNDPS